MLRASYVVGVGGRRFRPASEDNTVYASEGQTVRHRVRQPLFRSIEMLSDEPKTIDDARAAIEAVLANRALSKNPVPYFAPTDLAGLPPMKQEAELRVRDDTALFNRTRASIYMCLTAAHAALEVTLALMDEDLNLSHRDGARKLMALANGAEAASEAAHHASLVLMGRETPPVDESVEIRRG
ncbi:hypothetical protein LJR290_007685 [Variovorax sp. LjRoot290]|uniref:hypothetical protein n=2 Tax=Variovorax TaxID=34072 RepID=UPI003ED15851